MCGGSIASIEIQPINVSEVLMYVRIEALLKNLIKTPN